MALSVSHQIKRGKGQALLTGATGCVTRTHCTAGKKLKVEASEILKSSKEVTAHIPLLPSPQSHSLEAEGDGKPAMCPAAIQGQDCVPQVAGGLILREGLSAAA